MNPLRSGYVNHRMMNLRRDAVAMAAGIKPATLQGYTLRAMKMGPTFLDGRDWRAACMKCKGEGKLDPNSTEYEIMEIDMRRRVNVCFACQGKGTFPLPKIETYKTVIILWVMDRLLFMKEEEIAKVAQSEIDYIGSIVSTGENAEYEKEVQNLWVWIQRRLGVHNNGGQFWTAEHDPKIEAAFYRQHPIMKLTEEQEVALRF